MKAVLIYSGGLDSTTLLYEYRKDIALAVTFDYGSKHGKKEIACAIENCKQLGIKHIIIPLDFIGEYFRSDLLMSGGEIPEGNYDDENMRSTVVPFRNGIMLAIAAGLAEVDADLADTRLENLLRARWKSLSDDPQGRLKLIRFALSRGYEYPDVERLTNEITR